MSEHASSEQRSVSPQAGGQTSEKNRELRRAELDARVRGDLWSAVWEASQVMTYDEIREHVEGTIQEIVSDEP